MTYYSGFTQQFDYLLIICKEGPLEIQGAFLFGIFALAASIGELGWKIRCAADEIYKAIYDENDGGDG